MSTDKNGTRRSIASKEKNSLSKTSTRKTSKDRTTKKLQEKTQKDSPTEEKELTKSKKNLSKDKNGQLNKPENRAAKPSQNKNVPSRSTITNSKPSSSIKGPVTKSKSNPPDNTPTSSKVKKSQYFPSKNLYSNALKSVEMQSKILEEGLNIPRKINTEAPKKSINTRSKSERLKRPLIKSNIIQTSKESRLTPRDSSPDTSSAIERPRTATLRKGSIVNENIVGPEAPKYTKNVLVIKEAVSPKPDDNYEDDFESYESDFEEETSSDTNLAITSGTMSSSAEDVSERQSASPLPLQKDNKRLSSAGTDDERKLDSGTFELTDFKHRQILKYIEDTVRKEDAILEQDNLKEKISHSSLSDEGFEDQKSLQFINFAHARKKCQERLASAARKKRGEQLLSMIKLDSMNFTIFDSPSVSYDVYITNYGQGNSVQASAQTGDDDLSEEIQTDTLISHTKWTQMPITFSSFNDKEEHFWNHYKYEYLGVGEEFENVSKNEESQEINETRLPNFLRNSGELILQILSEEDINNITSMNKNTNNLPFSEGYLKFNTARDIFTNTTVQDLSLHSKSVSKILTVHLKNRVDLDLIRSIVCVWDINDLSGPRSVLVSFGEVGCASFSLDGERYVLAGQQDGALLVWDLEERNTIYNITSHTPLFITSIGSSHVSKIVSVQSVPQEQRTSSDMTDEVCSLDELGTLIIWTLYRNVDSYGSVKKVTLINTQTINFQDVYPQFSDLSCSDCIIMDSHVYVSTNYGFILHHLLKSNQTGIKMFVPESKIDAPCLEACPFSPSYFVAGYSNGDISLFSRTTERPLLILKNKEQIDSAGVQIIRWSKTKPFLFYVKDSKNFIHIWDLCKSDMYPEYSIAFPENISCIKLSPVPNYEKEEPTYVLVGTEKGEIYLHLLNKEYGQEHFEKYQEHVKVFLDYVNRL